MKKAFVGALLLVACSPAQPGTTGTPPDWAIPEAIRPTFTTPERKSSNA